MMEGSLFRLGSWRDAAGNCPGCRQIRKVCNRKRERLDELLKNQFLVWSNGLATENADVVA